MTPCTLLIRDTVDCGLHLRRADVHGLAAVGSGDNNSTRGVAINTGGVAGGVARGVDRDNVRKAQARADWHRPLVDGNVDNPVSIRGLVSELNVVDAVFLARWSGGGETGEEGSGGGDEHHFESRGEGLEFGGVVRVK